MNPTDEIIGALFQVLAFALIPFLVYLVRKKTFRGFFGYVGLKASNRKANGLAVAACMLFAAPPLVLASVSNDFRDVLFSPDSVTGQFRQMPFGAETMVILVVKAVFKTSLSEELFFRGFVAKRLIHAFGFVNGNLVQASLFGLIHTGLFALTTQDPVFLTTIFLVPATGAYVSAYLNEKVADGSIVPGWISHALANVIAYSVIGFMI